MDFLDFSSLPDVDEVFPPRVVVEGNVDPAFKSVLNQRYSNVQAVSPIEIENSDVENQVYSLEKYSSFGSEQILQVGDNHEFEFPKESEILEISNKIRREVNELKKLKDDWDGYDGKAPSLESVEDTLEFLNHWPFDIVVPEVELRSNGSISLQVYSIEGYTLGSVRFFRGHRGAYSVVDRRTPIDRGLFKSNDISEIIQAKKKFRESIIYVTS